MTEGAANIVYGRFSGHPVWQSWPRQKSAGELCWGLIELPDFPQYSEHSVALKNEAPQAKVA